MWPMWELSFSGWGYREKESSGLFKPIGVGLPSPVSCDQISFPPGSKTDPVPSFHFLFENEKHLFLECFSDFLLLLVAYGTFWSW